MIKIGVRELRQQATQILRRVQEEQEEYIITYRGRAVARLIPMKEEEQGRIEAQEVWAEMERLTEEVSARWPSDVSAVEAIREIRREL